jgi:hypothetical protein
VIREMCLVELKAQQSRVSWEILYDTVELVMIGNSKQLGMSLS